MEMLHLSLSNLVMTCILYFFTVHYYKHENGIMQITLYMNRIMFYITFVLQYGVYPKGFAPCRRPPLKVMGLAAGWLAGLLACWLGGLERKSVV